MSENVSEPLHSVNAVTPLSSSSNFKQTVGGILAHCSLQNCFNVGGLPCMNFMNLVWSFHSIFIGLRSGMTWPLQNVKCFL